MQCVL
jgi:alpha-galactosidase